MKDKVRVSFDIPVEEHILYKTECVKSRIPIKDFMHTLVMLGMENYKKAKFNEKMESSLQQAKEGHTKIVSMEQLDQWELELEDDTH